MAKEGVGGNGTESRVLSELEDIKRLLMLLLMKAGTSQGELGLAIGKDQGDVSRMMPRRKIKPFNGAGVRER
jgi:hypothetical protein